MKIERVPLGTYVKVVGGFAFKAEDFSDDGIPVIRISDLQNGSVTLDNVAHIPKTRVARGDTFRVDPGDILVAMSGATTGKIGLAPSQYDGILLQNQRVGNFKIADISKIYKNYLRHFVSSPSYQGQIWRTMVGVAQPNISPTQLESFEIPLPPLAEQRRIAEVLDRAEALRTKRRAALAQLDSLT
jgi:type I restriction enzyme S subunit